MFLLRDFACLSNLFSYFTGNLNVSEQIWDNFMLKFNRILIFKSALDAGGHCCCPVGGAVHRQTEVHQEEGHILRQNTGHLPSLWF